MIFADFVIVYIKMIIDFKNFLFTLKSLMTIWSRTQPGHKQITKVWKSIFLPFLMINECCPKWDFVEKLAIGIVSIMRWRC